MADLLLTCSDGNIRSKFLFGSYIPRHRLESVIPEYSIHTGAVADRLTHILLKTLDSSALEPCRNTTPRKEDNSAQSWNSRFSNREGDKEAKLTDCSFNSNNWKYILILYYRPAVVFILLFFSSQTSSAMQCIVLFKPSKHPNHFKEGSSSLSSNTHSSMLAWCRILMKDSCAFSL